MRIVYSSFAGRYSDNPRAIFETLQDHPHEHLWLVDPDHAAGFPDDVDGIPYGGRACLAALESADLVVSNTHFELEWTKAPHATYLQTWHGTPLKRIHWDSIWTPAFRMDVLDRDVAMWDVLLSPSPYATEVFRRAFRFDREVLEIGSPRDDALLGPDRSTTRALVRAQHGIPPEATAVLYAPTWRDDEIYGEDGEAELPPRFDVERFLTATGGEHHLLLRLHYLQTGRLRTIDHPLVHDASYHPDVRDLLLAADLLVTDYSSLMFDWAVTGKPMAFLADDLERYRDQVRGFCFDLVAEAPGPVVRTTGELLEALTDPGALTGPAHPAYAAFQARYCPLEDGRASERVAEWLLRLPGLRTRSAPPVPGPARP